MLAGQAIFAVDTLVKMLAPGTGNTATARLWAYGRDERPWGSDVPPASWYRFSPDRKGQHPKDHLSGYRGWMHADGYAGFEDIYRSSDIHEVACMAHVGRMSGDIRIWPGGDTRNWSTFRLIRFRSCASQREDGPNRQWLRPMQRTAPPAGGKTGSRRWRAQIIPRQRSACIHRHPLSQNDPDPGCSRFH